MMQLTIFNSPQPESDKPCLNQIYKLNNQYFRCKRIRPSGINTFQLVDKNGKDIVEYCTRNPNVILDYGIRLITKKLSK